MARYGKMGALPESIKAERDILTKLIRVYKENAFMWNTCHPDYNNKVKKKEAQEKLVNIYKEIDPNANMPIVKKKLDNMRSSGKRYFKRKLEGHTKGKSCPISLWYYDEIKFLYGDDQDTENDDEPTIISLDEEESESTNDRSNIYMTEYNNSLYEDNVSTTFTVDDSVASPSSLSNESKEKKMKFSISEEANLFGTAVDHQLSEVTPEQKDLAEKLISRIIYLARMNKLTNDTDISLKKSIIIE